MEGTQARLYKELRQTEQEILHSLKEKKHSDKLRPILEKELDDLQTALIKMEQGNYGICEISGELIPLELLSAVPTIKSARDIRNLETYCRKPLHLYC